MEHTPEWTAQPALRNTLLYSIVIPAYNEEMNILPTLEDLAGALRAEGIPFELVVVNDNSSDKTAEVVARAHEHFREVRLQDSTLPPGFGRAIRCGLEHARGEVIAVVMADQSDSPGDVVRCYRKIEEGYDCVYGSRFIKGSRVTAYPPLKRIVQRTANRLIQLMFLTRHNDMTNAFKVYRRHALESVMPLQAAHFNITIEMSLSVLIRGFRIARIPIDWSGRTWGASKLHIREMGRRYICTLLKIWFERMLVHDDLMAEMTGGEAQPERRGHGQ